MLATIRRIICVALIALASGIAHADDLLLLGVGTTKKTGSTGPFSLVQSSSNGNGSPSQTLTVTLSGTTAGNFLAVTIIWCNNGSCNTSQPSSVSTVTSSAGETCSQVSGADNTTSAQGRSDIWYCANIVGGTDTITITMSLSSPDFIQAVVSEWTGVATVSPVDGTIANHTFTNSAPSSPLTITTSGNTSANNDLIISCITIAPGTPSSNQTPIGSGSLAAWELAATSGSTYSIQWIWTGSPVWLGASIAAFKHQ